MKSLTATSLWYFKSITKNESNLKHFFYKNVGILSFARSGQVFVYTLNGEYLKDKARKLLCVCKEG